jgi:hypothetical protein
VGPPGADGGNPGLADIGGCVEIGFADLEMDHVPTLRLERPGADQDFECRFCAEALHSGRESHLTAFDFVFARMIAI